MSDDNDILQTRMIEDEQRRVAAGEPVEQAPEADPIKQQALDFALKKYGVQARDEDVIKAAAEFEKYLRG